MVGAVDDHSALVWARVAIDADVRVLTNSSPTNVGATASLPVLATAATDHCVVVPVTGLPAGSTIWYRVRVSQPGVPGNAADGPWGRFRTAPEPNAAAPIRFVVGGDVRSPATHDHGLWPVMKATDPDFFLSLGDFPYADLGGAAVTVAEYRAKHLDARSDLRCQDFHRDVPIFPVWDDHEVLNNWDGDTAPSRVAAGVTAFHQMLPTPRGRRDIYRSFRYGRHLEVFLTDCRMYRSPNRLPDLPGKTMLGAAQEAWLLQALRNSTATFKVVAVSVPVAFNRGRDSWPGFRAAKRRLLDGIAADGVSNVLFVSADTHRTGVHDLQEGFRELMVSPIANGTGSGWARQDRNRRFDYDDSTSFGLITIDPAASPPTMTIEIRNRFALVHRQVVGAGHPASISFEQEEPGAQANVSGARFHRLEGRSGVLRGVEPGPTRIDWFPVPGWDQIPAPLVLDVAEATRIQVAADWRDERAPGSEVLFAADFHEDLSGLSVVDVGNQEGPSAWLSDEGYLWQASNVNGPQNGSHLPGTFATTGPRSWTDVTVRVRARSGDNDAMGVAFRWNGPDDHYLFLMDSQRGRRWLVRRVGGVSTLLAADSVSYETWRWYDIEIRALGPGLEVRLDGEVILTASDSAHASGGAGLFTWADDIVSFDDLVVRRGDARAGSDPTLLEDRFSRSGLGLWSVRDESSSGGPSQWEVSGGELRQESNIGGGGAALGARGTVALAGSPGWSDVRFRAEIMDRDDDSFGLVLRDDGQRSWRFLMNAQEGWRRLVRTGVGGDALLASESRGYRSGQWYEVVMEARGQRLTVWVDGELFADLEDPGGPTRGRVGFTTINAAGARFDGVEVRRSLERRPTIASIMRAGGWDLQGAAPASAGLQVRWALALDRSPGISLQQIGLTDPRILPLALDDLFLFSLSPDSAPWLRGFSGAVDGRGRFQAAIDVPVQLPRGLAFEVGGWTHDPATPAVPVELLPAMRIVVD